MVLLMFFLLFRDSKISCEGSNSAAIVFKEAMENILSSDQSVKLQWCSFIEE
jgi:hypothetical protein